MRWLLVVALSLKPGFELPDGGALGRQADLSAFDLPHVHGRAEVLHLRSLLNPISPRLAVAFVPLLPARLVELLEERGVRLVDVPEEELATMGPNVLGLDGGQRAVALAGNDEAVLRRAASLIAPGEPVLARDLLVDAASST